MATLIAYYSRTGANASVAKELQSKLKCDIEEIIGKASYSGAGGYLSGGYRAARKKTDEIEAPKKDPSKYSLTIIVYPIWAGRMPPAVRAYISKFKAKLKSVAVVSVSGSGGDKPLNDFEEAAGKAKASLFLSGKEIKTGSYKKSLEELISKLK